MIRTADGGTLFLDEVGDLPIDVQPKLLRFLQEGEIQPLGDKKPMKVDVRIIAATNMPLEDKGRGRHISRGPLLPAKRDPASRCRRFANAVPRYRRSLIITSTIIRPGSVNTTSRLHRRLSTC